jgi:hypothetical protein
MQMSSASIRATKRPRLNATPVFKAETIPWFEVKLTTVIGLVRGTDPPCQILMAFGGRYEYTS